MLAAKSRGRLIARALHGRRRLVRETPARTLSVLTQRVESNVIPPTERFRSQTIGLSYRVLSTPSWHDEDRDNGPESLSISLKDSMLSTHSYPGFYQQASRPLGLLTGVPNRPSPSPFSGHNIRYFSTESSMQSNKTPAPGSIPPPIGHTSIVRPPRVTPHKLGKTQIPTPASKAAEEADPLNTIRKTTPKSIINKGLNGLVAAFQVVFTFLFKLPGNVFFYLTHPKELGEAWQKVRDTVVHEAKHYWVGTKLLWADIRTARHLMGKTLGGSTLTRRERKQLLRTVSDLFRLVPFSMFVLIPFMEFALPFALRIFPNMLPSTYQDSLKAEENMKRELKSRIAMAQFFQETLEELAKEQKRKASKRKKELEEAGEGDSTIAAQKDSAHSMLGFLEKARNGEMVPQDVIVKYATYFQDDLTLDNMPRMQLINMCKYMGIQPYGSDAFLRFQLRHKIRVLKEDDQRILWEGIDSLTKMELREACQERGMRSTGLSKDAYRRSLQEWLDLSVNKDLPIALLIMSRTFFLREDTFETESGDASQKSLSDLADAMSGMQKEIVNEVILEVATEQEKKSHPDVRKIKLEVVSQQNELIRAEEEARQAAAKKKEAAEKEKEAAEKSPTEGAEIEQSVDAITDSSVSKETEEDTAPVAAPPTDAEVPPTKVSVPSEDEKPRDEEEPKDEEKHQLSTEEMDAISQLLTDDPCIKEREELEKIKAAMKGDEKAEEAVADVVDEQTVTAGSPIGDAKAAEPTEAPSPPAEEHLDATTIIVETERLAAKEAEAATKITMDDHLQLEKSEETPQEEPEKEETEDPIVARLQKRVKSMVDKIEVQLSETQVKIGDKMHVLDKDDDGLLTRDEMAEALQQVLKRKISLEEALKIADTMDGNQDGFFTADELIQWIETQKLVKFAEEGRDHDMDKIVENYNEKAKQDDPTANEQEKGTATKAPPS